MFKTTDGGAHWSRVSTGLTNTQVRSLAIVRTAPATLYAGTLHGGLFRTTDGGASWSARSSGLPDAEVLALALDPVTPSTLYAAIDGSGIFKSTDGGASWFPRSTGLTSLHVRAIVIDPSNPAVLYVGTSNPGCLGIFKSTNGGASWALNNGAAPPPPNPFGLLCVQALAIDPVAPTTLYVGTFAGGVSRSLDGGMTWQPLNLGLPFLDVRALALDPVRGTVLYAGTGAASVFDFQLGDSVAVLGIASHTVDGFRSNGASGRASVSADGRLVAFQSMATNLTLDCANGVSHVFVRDQTTGTVTCVSVTPGGAAGDGPSRNPSISGDGNVVVFESDARNLVTSCANGAPQIFARHRGTGALTCVSVGPGGVAGDAPSRAPDVSRDGRVAVFESMATNLAPTCRGGIGQVFVRDETTGTTVCASVGPGDIQGDDESLTPKISADATTVVFESMARNLDPRCVGPFAQVHVRNLVAGTTACASVSVTGGPGNGASHAPDVSGDGTLVAFESGATNLAPICTTGVVQVYLRSLLTGTTQCLTVSPTGAPGDGPSGEVAVSQDGRVVTFSTQAANLQGGKSGTVAVRRSRQTGKLLSQILSRDVAANIFEQLTQALGSAGDGDSRRPAVSGDGRVVAFESAATNLVADNPSGQTNVLVVDQQAPPPTGRAAITAPATRSVFSQGGGSRLTLAWTAVSNAARYGVEYTGANLSFANPNGTGPDAVNGFGGAGGGFIVAGTSVAVPLDSTLPLGAYQVRVIGLTAGGQLGGTFSDAVTVLLAAGQSAGDQVTLLSPPPGSPVARGGPVTFSWTPLPGVGRYLFEFTGAGRVFANPNGTAPDPGNAAGGAVPIEGNSFTTAVPPAIPPGSYQVRVIGLSATGQPVGHFSDAVTLVVQ